MRAKLCGRGMSAELGSSRGESDSPIEAVAHGDVESLAKDAVALLRVGDDLSVAPRDVEDDRRRGSGNESAGLDVWSAPRRLAGGA